MARLARLDIRPDRIDTLAEEMSAIVAHMDAIASWPVPPDEKVEETPSLRRTDEVHNPSDTGLIEATTHHQNGEVIVPPVKDAS